MDTPTAPRIGAAAAPPPLRLADFYPQARQADPLFQDWLAPWHDALFAWTLARAANDEGRRAVAEMAVTIQRLRGSEEMRHWLLGTALQAAARQANCGGLPEAWLAGLPPELRSLLRLVAQQLLRREEALALTHQRLSHVRRRLLQARLQIGSSLAGRAQRAAAVPSADSASVWLMNQDLNESLFISPT